MRVDQRFGTKWREILAEQLTDGEVRQVLKRLYWDAGIGSGGETIGTVCEATGSSPARISRLLAEIRGVDWQTEFGDRLADPALYLPQQAVVLSNPRLGAAVLTPAELDGEEHALHIRGSKFRGKKIYRQYAVAGGIVLVVALLGSLVMGGSAKTRAEVASRARVAEAARVKPVRRVDLENGVYLHQDEKGSIVAYVPGLGDRRPTISEMEWASILDVDSYCVAKKAQAWSKRGKGIGAGSATR